MKQEQTDAASADDIAASLQRRHLRIGWWSLLVFLSLGIALEAMHGFKIGWYLEVDHETRRLMLRLAHVHGALLGVLHVAFAATVRMLLAPGTFPMATVRLRNASPLLVWAGILLPLGFFTSGVVLVGGDPNPAVLLVPAGAVCLLIGVLLTARAAASSAK